MDKEITIEARGLRKSYGAVTAVADLTLSARAGEVVGLLGPNGAGKTTAIRMLTTIIAPSAGRFAVAGAPHSQPVEIRRRIGVLPESSGYPEHPTGAEFLTYFGGLYGLSRGEARTRAGGLLEEVGLGERATSPVGTYSRGMRQRLGIARALLNEPRVVFFDEPTLGLDPAGQREVLSLIAGIAGARGATVLLSTHFLEEVEETCSRVVILNRGRVAGQGTVAEITQQAAAPRRARIRVPAQLRAMAIEVLGALPASDGAQPLDGRPDWLVMTLDSADAGPARVGAAVAALTAAGIPLLAFELEGARLSDAFLAMTGGA
jgi:ABC-2 type transport system ATP-binding protein